jgi:hypothetical protein
LKGADLLCEDVDCRRQVEDLQRYSVEVHGEDIDLGRVGADLGRLDDGCICGVGEFRLGVVISGSSFVKIWMRGTVGAGIGMQETAAAGRPDLC